MSVLAPMHGLPIPSIHPSDNKHKDFLVEFPSTSYGEKNLSEIMVKTPDDIALHQVKFPDETPDITNGVIYPANFLSTQIQVNFIVINLHNYVFFQVASCAMRCLNGSNNEILLEWDPGPTYVVQRLWDPGGPTYSSTSSVPTDLDKVGYLESYLDYIHLPGQSSLPFLVAVMPNLAPNNHQGKLDHMGSFRFLPRLDKKV